MARARIIKPGFFTNDRLGELPIAARLLFCGLWTIADRAGRLEDRPKKIKAEVLPWDRVDVDALLQSLHEAGFILRYESGEHRFIQISAFAKHQSPHVREPASSIPAPGEHSASTGLAPDETGTGPAVYRSRSGSSNPEPDAPAAAASFEEALPIGVRERTETILSALPADRREQCRAEAELLAADVTDSQQIARAMANIRRMPRGSNIPWPSVLRDELAELGVPGARAEQKPKPSKDLPTEAEVIARERAYLLEREAAL